MRVKPVSFVEGHLESGYYINGLRCGSDRSKTDLDIEITHAITGVTSLLFRSGPFSKKYAFNRGFVEGDGIVLVGYGLHFSVVDEDRSRSANLRLIHGSRHELSIGLDNTLCSLISRVRQKMNLDRLRRANIISDSS